MNFGRAGFNSFRRSAGGKSANFRNFARMQPNMNFSQMNMLSKQIVMGQSIQGRLTSANILLMNIQMNQLMLNDEAECGINPNSEDLGKYYFSRWLGSLLKSFRPECGKAPSLSYCNDLILIFL